MENQYDELFEEIFDLFHEAMEAVNNAEDEDSEILHSFAAIIGGSVYAVKAEIGKDTSIEDALNVLSQANLLHCIKLHSMEEKENSQVH